MLTASLRMQTSTQAGEKEAKKEDNGGISSERYVLICSISDRG